MKHNLLRNFLALVLSGIMLAGVGCKNYDDDIDKINNRLDELYVTVADLDEQIESVRNAIPSLDALNEEVAALRSELDGVKTDVASIDQKLEAIGDVQAKLNELSQELKDYVNGAIQSSEETLRNELATKGAVSELEALIEGIQEDYKAELEEINNKLHRDTDADRFITLGCCLLDRSNSLIEFGRAGHTDLISYIHGHIRTVSPDGTALGILPDEFATFDTFCMSFEPGTTLMMYSDGLSEALNRDSEEFGVRRLTEVFRRSCELGGTSQAMMHRILDEVASFEAEQNDDQTIVLIRHTGKA